MPKPRLFPMWCALLLMIMVRLATAQVTPDEANAFYQAQAWDQAAAAYATLAEQDTTNATAWYRWANSLKQLGEYERAIDVWRALDARGGAPLFVKHSIATAYALHGQTDEAFDWLEQAVAAGFSNLPMLTDNPDLATLRDDARFEAILAQADRNARPCEFSEDHRKFDFWAGEWDVFSSAGQSFGVNRIEKSQNGCVLIENWTGSNGGTGMSINYYDPGRDVWVQNWVGAGGWVVDMEGGLADDGSMVLEGTSAFINNPPSLIRATWTLLPDGRVRQYFETSNDEGATWSPAFEGFYVRRNSEGD